MYVCMYEFCSGLETLFTVSKNVRLITKITNPLLPRAVKKSGCLHQSVNTGPGVKPSLNFKQLSISLLLSLIVPYVSIIIRLSVCY